MLIQLTNLMEESSQFRQESLPQELIPQVPLFREPPSQEPLFQEPRKKLTKWEATIRWQKKEFIRKMRSYVHYDLPNRLPKFVAVCIRKRIDSLLDWAETKV
jgi:hypothetical protein